VIGAKALNEKLPREAKLEARAIIGHLIDFDLIKMQTVESYKLETVFLRDKLCDGQGQFAKSYVREVA
jgi:hypothetical protein